MLERRNGATALREEGRPLRADLEEDGRDERPGLDSSKRLLNNQRGSDLSFGLELG